MMISQPLEGRGAAGRPVGRRALCLFSLLLVCLGALATGRLAAQELTFFRIGTASTGGTYFPVGGIIASAISAPPGSRPCDEGGSCGVPGLVAVAQSTEGSVANVLGIANGLLESGLSQADIAYWAYNGEGIFADGGPITSLRLIANLFPEAIHVVVRRDADIRSMADLKGKRVSIDKEGSGTRVDALLILEAFGLDETDIDAVGVTSGQAADMLRAGELDAFIFIAGTPANAVAELADSNLITLLPLQGPQVDALIERYPFFSHGRIESGTYLNVGVTPTVTVAAQWLIAESVPAETVYQITRALWHPNTRRLLDNGHPKARLISLETALRARSVPIHPGAERYYEEVGLLEIGP